MDKVSDVLFIRVPIKLRAEFQLRARRLGFSMSEAVKGMIKDFTAGKITLTKYPYLDSRRRYKPPKPIRPAGRPRKSPQPHNPTNTEVQDVNHAEVRR